LTSLELFEALAPRLYPAIMGLGHYTERCCIFATRVAMDVGAYFGIDVWPQTVQAVAYNQKFREHVEAEDFGLNDWRSDGSHSVGIGHGLPGKPGVAVSRKTNQWNGHLIAVARGPLGCEAFGDFAINQAERIDKDIRLGVAIFGPYSGQEIWAVVGPAAHGTVIEYRRTEGNDVYRTSPDWKQRSRREKLVGALIREIRKEKHRCRS